MQPYILFSTLSVWAKSVTIPMKPRQQYCHNVLERFLYDLEMKTREQNRNNKRTEIERFDWLIELIQTHLAFGWLSERSRKKTSCPRTF